ncbi:MAG: Rrf2 family transcriptional regulator [Campylobacteraceae bacterium]|nr:Rrf2 family transcriptional regulator [Campylobacteraceae bacterium]
MPLLTTKGVYGLMAVREIAHASEVLPISIKEISENSGISKGYLEQILSTLKENGIVESKKGKGGGYYLLKSLDEITFYELYSTLEADFGMTNLEIKDEVLKEYFKENDEELKRLFSKPLSDLVKFRKDSTKYLNFVI